ncbi:MAG: translation initiation factor IF-2 subunit beta [Candidatus Njordarchaeia archaeon]|nr:translation initiation factor IF-2 subunit beta [Candidatus Korarchaeota archaeon]
MTKTSKNTGLLNNLEYEKMLDRALNMLPTEIKMEESFEIPKLEIIIEGQRTTIINWKDIIKKLDRDEKIVLRYLEHRLGTVGWISAGRAVFQGRYKKARLNKLIDLFIREYVICDVCGRPHTRLVKEKGRWIKICDACGAWRVVEKI